MPEDDTRRVLTRVVRRLPDDTEQYVPEDVQKRAEAEYDVPHFPTQQAQRAIDAFLALQLGLWQILSALKLYSIDSQALLRGHSEYREFQFERIFFDWAEMKNDRVPNNSVTILQAAPTSYDSYVGRETFLLEDSVDQFCPGTVLKVTHTAEVDLHAICWMTNKDDRGGVRRALEDAFDEPLDDRAGRRVIITQYWNQTARYTLQEVDYADTQETAKDNTWPLVLRVKADINVVKLVKRPDFIRDVLPNVIATTEDISS